MTDYTQEIQALKDKIAELESMLTTQMSSSEKKILNSDDFIVKNFQRELYEYLNSDKARAFIDLIYATDTDVVE